MTNQERWEFCVSLWQDHGLMAELRAETDRVAFIARIVTLAADRGYALAEGEVTAVMSANYSSWMQRWI